jgi:hypothetical protein
MDPVGVLSGAERGLTEDDLLLSVPKTEASLGQLWVRSEPRSVLLYEAVSITAENSLARIAWYG